MIIKRPLCFFLFEASISNLPTVEKLKDEVARRDETISKQQKDYALLVNDIIWRISEQEKEKKEDPEVIAIPKKSELVF